MPRTSYSPATFISACWHRALADTLISVTAYTGVTKPRRPPRLRGGVCGRCERRAQRRSWLPDRRRGPVAVDRCIRPVAKLKRGEAEARSRGERNLSATWAGRIRDGFGPSAMGFALHPMRRSGKCRRGFGSPADLGARASTPRESRANSLPAQSSKVTPPGGSSFLQLVWAGGRGGRAIARAAAWYRNRAEAFAGLVARAREEFALQRTPPSHDQYLEAMESLRRRTFAPSTRHHDVP